MIEIRPWENVAVPSTDFNVRLVEGEMAVPCFWGRDAEGAYLFIVELQGNHTTQYRKSIIVVSGIRVELRSVKDESQRLVLTLEDLANCDLFLGLCRALVKALLHASDSASSLLVALAHIKRWKHFFSGRVSTTLSNEEVRGLFAELVFLGELFNHMPSSSAAVDAWLGPEKSHQDFIFGNTAIEIKSLSGTERSSIRISSEDQLECLNDDLFLRVYRLSSLLEAVGSRSLNDVVLALRMRLDDFDSLEKFDRKLIKQGYVPLPEYDEPRFAVTNFNTFKVEKNFPRVIRSGLPIGISKVAYDIKLEAIASFRCNNDSVFRDF